MNVCYNALTDELAIYAENIPPFCLILRSANSEYEAQRLIQEQETALKQEAEAILHERARQMMCGKSVI